MAGTAFVNLFAHYRPKGQPKWYVDPDIPLKPHAERGGSLT